MSFVTYHQESSLLMSFVTYHQETSLLMSFVTYHQESSLLMSFVTYKVTTWRQPFNEFCYLQSYNLETAF